MKSSSFPQINLKDSRARVILQQQKEPNWPFDTFEDDLADNYDAVQDTEFKIAYSGWISKCPQTRKKGWSFVQPHKPFNDFIQDCGSQRTEPVLCNLQVLLLRNLKQCMLQVSSDHMLHIVYESIIKLIYGRQLRNTSSEQKTRTISWVVRPHRLKHSAIPMSTIFLPEHIPLSKC